MFDATTLVADSWSEGWAPPPLMAVSDWSDSNIVLSGKSAGEKGPYRTERTPYAREPMDAMGINSQTEEIVLMWAAQTGKTSVLINCAGYWSDVEPAPIMIVQPTLNLAKRFSKQRIAPTIQSSPVLLRKFADNKSRDDSNTTLMKDFDGGVLVLAGANAATDLRSVPVCYLMLDEIDGYPADVDGEGDPVDLATARQTTFWRKKRIKTSTPTDEITSRIEPDYKAGTQEHYQVQCPHCAGWDHLKWANLKWSDAAAPWIACEQCGGVIEEHHKSTLLAHGRWVADHPDAGIARRSFHLNGLYSPIGWYSWSQMVAEFLVAKKALDRGDASKMKVFVNTRLAETWKETGTSVKWEELQARAEKYPLRTVPRGALMLVASVDVQGNRIECKAKAFGRGEESWTVDYVAFHGDPAVTGQGSVWASLDDWLRSPLTHESGEPMRIQACAIDSGGHHTHVVYGYARDRKHLHVFAVKGQSQSGKPVIGRPSDVELNYQGKKIPRGAQVWPVGSDTAKALIYGRMRVNTPGLGYQHHSADLPPEYFQQLVSEVLVTKYLKGRARLEWVLPSGKRNEALDLDVYALAAFYYLGGARMRERDWARRERLFTGLFATVAPTEKGYHEPALPAGGGNAAESGSGGTPAAGSGEAPGAANGGPQSTAVTAESVPRSSVQTSAEKKTPGKQSQSRPRSNFINGWKK